MSVYLTNHLTNMVLLYGSIFGEGTSTLRKQIALEKNFQHFFTFSFKTKKFNKLSNFIQLAAAPLALQIFPTSKKIAKIQNKIN